jgi:dATP pyrophosphohydrolase
MRSLVDVYPYRFVEGEIQFLLLHRAKEQLYEGQWRMIGGKLEENETHVQAADREYIEETGLQAKIRWVVPTINAFYDHNLDQIQYIPVFAFECDNKQVFLNHEHDDFKWCNLSEALEKVSWYEQKRIIGVIHEILRTSGILKEWIL